MITPRIVAAEGPKVGFVVAFSEGFLLGFSLGFTVGFPLGFTVGFMVGFEVGFVLGLKVPEKNRIVLVVVGKFHTKTHDFQLSAGMLSDFSSVEITSDSMF